ncbi:MAG TPA: DoxX family protein [Pirellulales bacterium]|nr:DoxX family protein [Pirellulales bacterium]
MLNAIQGLLSVAGRVLLAAIFLASAAGNKIPNFNSVVELMGKVGVPAPRLMLLGAIVFLLVGGVSVVLGFYARLGAFLLLVFLALASHYFHGFWRLEGAEAMEQQIQFMKNLSMAGAMLFMIANGAGAWSLDARRAAKAPLAARP